MTMPLKQKDLDLFFRPRLHQGSAVNSDEDAVSSPVESYAEVVEDAVEEEIVETAGAVEVGEALEEVVEAPLALVDEPLEELVEEPIEELVDEAVAPVETVRPKLRKRNQAPCIPCYCTVAGPCYGQQYSSQATLAVHTANKHGDKKSLMKNEMLKFLTILTNLSI
jgi:hypothetical protein